jgi:site-specific recombinase XerC
VIDFARPLSIRRRQRCASALIKVSSRRDSSDPSGRPMSSRAIHAQIESRTRQAFGEAIWPHLFRDCAVTELVDCAPEQIGIAPDLLGHADLQTTQKHYIQAQGMVAHVRVQEVIVNCRRAAAARRSPGA